MLSRDLSPKSCIHCAKEFTPQFSTTQIACSLRCAQAYAVNERKTKEKRAKEQIKARKQAAAKLSTFKAAAQKWFNAFIRMRDADLPCVSCGETNPPELPGGQWDAGHFLSRGAYPELAFDEDNCHKQCKSCNGGSGKFAHKARTVSQAYEVEIERRIGAQRLARLKGPHPAAKRTREDYLALEETYKQKLKALKKDRE